MGLGPKVFTRKNGNQKGGKLYKWSPIPSDKRATKTDAGQDNFYCTATPYSQGEDWIVTYMETITVIDGVQKKVAYVACDYVK
jgi:hypothetical protein